MGYDDFDSVLAAAGVYRIGRDPRRDRHLQYLSRTGRLRRLLPGVHVEPAVADRLTTRVLAVMAFEPHAVICGAAAAALTFWPELEVPVISVAHRRFSGRPYEGFQFSRRVIPAELIELRNGVRVSRPAFTAVDLAGGALGGDPIDRALRSRAVRPAELSHVLQVWPDRDGNKQRRRLVEDSAYGPFSEFERRAHRILRRNRITDWVANEPYLFNGRQYLPDLRGKRVRFVMEFDSFQFHHTRTSFINDRIRWRDMTLAGWLVLPSGWELINNEAEFLSQVRRGLALARPIAEPLLRAN
ncbi:hypothetical protein [Nakamurella aerolata]|uniref:DUF559 domain-containing protein n=1 Tax=Nakamurella aerolata TaxID=1656892 RepID=A0A849AA74_9ACTN|nr:hypothetical protein [Nakamurella aerolata]NNG36018.1 hypothetical protein [Nakamurella aerolata]